MLFPIFSSSFIFKVLTKPKWIAAKMFGPKGHNCGHWFPMMWLWKVKNRNEAQLVKQKACFLYETEIKGSLFNWLILSSWNVFFLLFNGYKIKGPRLCGTSFSVSSINVKINCTNGMEQKEIGKKLSDHWVFFSLSSSNRRNGKIKCPKGVVLFN